MLCCSYQSMFNKKLKVSLTSGFNHVAWLFALFSFQRTILFSASFEVPRRFKRLIYLIAFRLACQELFWKFFATKSWWVKSVRMQSHLDFVWGLIKNRKIFNLAFRSFSAFHSGLPIKACWAVSLPCPSATCIILHESEGIVNTFFEKNRKSLRGVRGTRRRKGAGITFACLDKLVKRDRKSSPPPPSSISARRCKRLCKSHKAQKLVMFFVTFDKPV